jgi:hypothetical protein
MRPRPDASIQCAVAKCLPGGCCQQTVQVPQPGHSRASESVEPQAQQVTPSVYRCSRLRASPRRTQ